ncbi:MAG: apolipoprotein N-acyltransferase [Candidatus Kapaibacteriota bacterium]
MQNLSAKLGKKRNYLIAVISGTLLTLSFPPLPFYLLAFVAFVPLLFVISDDQVKHKYLLIYITFFIYHTGSNWWISSWSKETDPFLLISGLVLDFFHPLFFLFPFWLFFIIKKHKGKNFALVLFPFIFVSFEWLHSLGDLSYPWLTVGYTQMSNLFWIQFIDITGIYGSSFLILIANVIILKLIYLKIETQTSNFFKLILNSKKGMQYVIILVLIIFLPFFYTFTIIQKYDYYTNLKAGKNTNIGIVQPNINPWAKWTESTTGQIEKHFNISDSLIKSSSNIDLLIWSETAIPYVYLDFNSLQDLSLITNWIKKENVSLLTGIAEFYLVPKGNTPPKWAKQFVFDSSQYYLTFNSAILLNPNSMRADTARPFTYRKTRLTPFAENFPLKDVIPFAVKWLMWGVGISNWNVGDGPQLLQVNNESKKYKIGPIICIESIYPNYVRHFTLQGAQILTVITNDGWYDHTVGPTQHFIIAAARAIENRRYLARVANTGISGFISPFGTTLKELPQYKSIGTTMLLPLLSDKTIYVIYGDWLAYISAIISFIAIVYSLIRK